MLRSTLFFAGVVAVVYGSCPDGCNVPTAVFEDLRCKPIYAEPTDCCPVKFDCSNINQRPENKCTYKGKVYDLKQEIPTEETYPNCRIGCRCLRTDSITCAILDCPEWLGARPKLGNYYTYTLNECCATGQRAAPFEVCKVGEKTFKEGERFDGDTRCTECVCDKGWNGNFKAPFCMKKTCTEEISNIYNIKKHCAPTYFNVKTACCPFKWICPDDENADDKITAATKKSESKEQCKYGTESYNIGDKFARIEKISYWNHYDIKCECKIPPFFTCEIKQISTGK